MTSGHQDQANSARKVVHRRTLCCRARSPEAIRAERAPSDGSQLECLCRRRETHRMFRQLAGSSRLRMGNRLVRASQFTGGIREDDDTSRLGTGLWPGRRVAHSAGHPHATRGRHCRLAAGISAGAAATSPERSSGRSEADESLGVVDPDHLAAGLTWRGDWMVDHVVQTVSQAPGYGKATWIRRVTMDFDASNTVQRQRDIGQR